jgi:hypothetical protein
VQCAMERHAVKREREREREKRERERDLVASPAVDWGSDLLASSAAILVWGRVCVYIHTYICMHACKYVCVHTHVCGCGCGCCCV